MKVYLKDERAHPPMTEQLSTPKMMKCKKCGKYTLKQFACPKCSGEVYPPKPPKYSPEDKYAKYRRMTTLEERKKEGLL